MLISLLQQTTVSGSRIDFGNFLRDVLSRDWIVPYAEAIAILAGLVTVILALAYFGVRRDVAVPILAIALAGALVIEMFAFLPPARSIDVGISSTPSGKMPISRALSTAASLLVLTFGIARIVFLRKEHRAISRPLLVTSAILVAMVAMTVYVYRTGAILPELIHRATLPPHWDIVLVAAGMGLLALFCWRYQRRDRDLVSTALLVAVFPLALSHAANISIGIPLLDGTLAIGRFDVESARVLRVLAYTIPFVAMTIQFQRAYAEQGNRFRTFADIPDVRSEKLRRANRQLEKQKAELEDTKSAVEVSNRILRDQQVRLVLTQQAAEAASAAKSEFLANMSHEIRTPMTAILGLTEEMLDDELTPDERRNFLRTILQNGHYLLELINEILDLSKIEARKMSIERAECSPINILGELEALMKPRAVAKGLEFSIQHVGPVPETIDTDAVRLRQILINLVGNAIKFTEIGSVRIEYGEVTVGATDGSGRDLSAMRFSVIDSGVGIPPEALKEIFQPFTQVDRLANRRSQGTGLGLTICRRLADMLGGAIEATSEEGKGSKFMLVVETGSLAGIRRVEDPALVLKRINTREAERSARPTNASRATVETRGADSGTPDQPERPASRSEDTPSTSKPAAESTSTPASVPKSNEESERKRERILGSKESLDCRILLAEDNDTIRMFVRRLLALAGAEVIEAEDGRRAVDLSIEALEVGEPFDVILMDMQMPVLDGFSATEELRERDYEGAIVAMTAGAMGTDREKFLKAGCDDFTIKPIDREHLFETIRKFLS